MILIGVIHADFLQNGSLEQALERIGPKSIGTESHQQPKEAVATMEQLRRHAADITRELTLKYKLGREECSVLYDCLATYGSEHSVVEQYAHTTGAAVHPLDIPRPVTMGANTRWFELTAERIYHHGRALRRAGIKPHEDALRNKLYEEATEIVRTAQGEQGLYRQEYLDYLEKREKILTRNALKKRPEVIIVGGMHALGNGYPVKPLYQRLGDSVTMRGFPDEIIEQFRTGVAVARH